MRDSASQDMIENHPFDEIQVGDSAHLTRTLKSEDIQLFAAMSGDVNPAHVDPEYANSTQFRGIIAHGMWGGALISTVLGTEFPGPGTIYLGQNLRFLKPVHIGDTLDVRVTVATKNLSNFQVTLDCRCTDQHGADVITGNALILAPTTKVRRPRTAPMQVRMWDTNLRYKQLLALATAIPPITVAVVHPCSDEALRGALEAADLGLIDAIFIGPTARIHTLAANAGLDLAGRRVIDVPHSHAAAKLAVTMARNGEVQALMTGSLDFDELLAEVVDVGTGLRTERHLSHVTLLDVPSYPKPLLISDAAINIEPDLNQKRDIVRNAIDLAHAIGIALPKVAILASIETIDAKMRSTIDAAALCKMAERQQISDAIVDGPLTFGNAVSMQAPRDKSIGSAVAGQADILIAPDLEAANMLTKQLQYLADAQLAGLVMGARVPIIMTSRADGPHAQVASCALALLVANAKAS